ncbi:zinc-finger domain-containing protein [Hellea sp.]|jgi:uncharacterized Zn-finger protein|nr:zinc-finger domain-containing protein [Hellea sp.]MDA9048181.1 zinc-finger domain-containing protein [Hellea sp.]MDC1088845.1 zinc-finger domain-containing protein [Hellea sp.]MDG1126148.1 zinc-finger domain-containing protein [Hellea sp.]
MPKSLKSQNPITIVTSKRISCDGTGGALGHPRIFIDMGQDNTAKCKYCDRIFKLKVA